MSERTDNTGNETVGHSTADEPHDPAWTNLIDGVRRFVASRVPASAVDDVTQDALLRVSESIDRLENPSRLESFVHTIVRRTIADHFRASAGERQERTESIESSGPDVTTPEPSEPAAHTILPEYDGDHDVHEEVLSWLRPMADNLPDKYRDALVLADFEGLTQQDVADRLALSLSGAKSRIQRAHRMLGDAVRECCDVEFGGEGRAVEYRPRDRCEDC